MKLTGGGAATEQNLTQSSVGSIREKLGQAKVFRSSVHPDNCSNNCNLNSGMKFDENWLTFFQLKLANVVEFFSVNIFPNSLCDRA